MEKAASTTDKRNQVQQSAEALPLFVEAVKTKKQYPGNFMEAEHITEAINLYAVALRSNKMLKYDSSTRTVTNAPDVNKYLDREYRQGWNPDII